MKHHKRNKKASKALETKEAPSENTSTMPITEQSTIEGDQPITEEMVSVIEQTTNSLNNLECPTILSQIEDTIIEEGKGLKIIEQGDYILAPDSEEVKQIVSQMQNADSGKFSKTKYWNQSSIGIENKNQENNIEEINNRLQDIVKRLEDIELYLKKIELMIKSKQTD